MKKHYKFIYKLSEKKKLAMSKGEVTFKNMHGPTDPDNKAIIPDDGFTNVVMAMIHYNELFAVDKREWPENGEVDLDKKEWIAKSLKPRKSSKRNPWYRSMKIKAAVLHAFHELTYEFNQGDTMEGNAFELHVTWDPEKEDVGHVELKCAIHRFHQPITIKFHYYK